MKQQLTTLKCMDKECGHEVTSHRIMDGLNCEKCGGPTLTYPTNNKYPIVRCKRGNHRRSFLVREGETFENYCPYCGAALTAIQHVRVEETYNLNIIHIEQALMHNSTLPTRLEGSD